MVPPYNDEETCTHVSRQREVQFQDLRRALFVSLATPLHHHLPWKARILIITMLIAAKHINWGKIVWGNHLYNNSWTSYKGHRIMDTTLYEGHLFRFHANTLVSTHELRTTLYKGERIFHGHSVSFVQTLVLCSLTIESYPICVCVCYLSLTIVPSFSLPYSQSLWTGPGAVREAAAESRAAGTHVPHPGKLPPDLGQCGES